MTTTQKVLLVWGAVLLFVALAATLVLAPKADTAPKLTKQAHGHAALLAVVMIVLGLCQPYVKMAEGSKQGWAIVLGLGSTFLPVGLLILLASKGFGGAVAMVSSIFIVLSTFVFMLGVIARAASYE